MKVDCDNMTIVELREVFMKFIPSVWFVLTVSLTIMRLLYLKLHQKCSCLNDYEVMQVSI